MVTTNKPRTDLGETREMRLISKVLGPEEGPLATFIARRRLPGPTWMRWQSIAYALRDHIGEDVTDQGISTWARRYGIPVDTHQNEPENLITLYREQLKAAGIKL